MKDPLAAPASPQAVYLSVGGNIGDAYESCRQGLDLVAELAQVWVRKISPFYRTAPVDYEDQAWFVNAAVCIETGLAPLALLAGLQAIQRRMGRVADKIRFGPRIIDLDILIFGQRVIDVPRLTVPHPRMHQRRFVLQPLADIDPGLRHPLSGRTVVELLEQLPADGQEMERLT